MHCELKITKHASLKSDPVKVEPHWRYVVTLHCVLLFSLFSAVCAAYHKFMRKTQT